MNTNNNPDRWTGVACYLELIDGGLTRLSREVAALTVQLAQKSGMRAYAATIESSDAPVCAEELAEMNFDKILIYHSPRFETYMANTYAEALIDALHYLHPSVMLVGASDLGKDIAPLAAAHFRTGLTADCTGLEIMPDGNLLQVRPAFGGNVMAEILTPETRPQFATVRLGAGSGNHQPKWVMSEIEYRSLPERTQRHLSATVLESEPARRESSITEAPFIIAIGCGLKSESDIAAVRRLAGSLGAMLASTRGLVERGWMPPSAQIGLSGHSVSPELLMTIGVSGSVQFMAGIGGAKYIVAINNDSNARIFSVAHLGLCCDLYEVLPGLEEKASSLKRAIHQV